MSSSTGGQEDFFVEESDRSARFLIDQISTILEKVIERLGNQTQFNPHSSNQVEISVQISSLFSLKALPAIKMREYVDRYYQYGKLQPNLLLAALILLDRALNTRLFTNCLSVHK
jgi:Cyclin